MFPLRPACAGFALLALSACAGSVTSYPSLAPRPVEQAAPVAQADATPAALDAAIMARAEALVAQAQRGDAAMDAAVQAACPAIARGLGATEGSEAWVAAEQAVSAVEAARTDTATALDDLDALVLEQARLAEGQPRAVDLAPLLAAAEDVTARDAAQSARLAGLRTGRCTG